MIYDEIYYYDLSIDSNNGMMNKNQTHTYTHTKQKKKNKRTTTKSFNNSTKFTFRLISSHHRQNSGDNKMKKKKEESKKTRITESNCFGVNLKTEKK